MLEENINHKFEQLFGVISSSSFLKKEALGGEIPFFICPYNPKQEVSVEKNIQLLQRRLKTQKGVEVVEVNLFRLCVQLLESRGLLAKIAERERAMSKERLLKALQNSLDIESRIIPAIAEIMQGRGAHHVLFLTGIGQVFPFIRSHQILNNLQSTATVAPTVIFFPGNYTGRALHLFDKLKDDNYYRAFNINDYKID